MPRPEISDEIITTILERFRADLRYQIAKKGRTGWVSSHETRGGVDKEVDEFHAAVHANNHDETKRELMDIMTAALWGLASEEAGGWDW